MAGSERPIGSGVRQVPPGSPSTPTPGPDAGEFPDAAARARAERSPLDPVTSDGDGLDDGCLIERAQRGSTEAFEVLVRRYRDRVYRVAFRLVGDRYTAEDVAQDALVTAWRALPGFRRDAAFATWLHSIVLNRARNQLTRTRPAGPLPAELPTPSTQQPADVIQSSFRDRALRAAIRDLPFDLRAPLVLRQFEGCSYEQAAEILGVSVSTVRGRIARARRTLLISMREWR
jgi:RNA polymerase sigma-70 factor (ECF subfamily)